MIYAYGDESASPEGVTFAIIAFPETSATNAERLLAEMKADLAVHSDSRVHCRELFSEAARRKSGWAHVQRDAFEAAILRLTAATKPLTVTSIVAALPVPATPPIIVAKSTGRTGTFDAKAIASIAANCAIMALRVEIGPVPCRVFLDSDRTKVQWAFGRRQSDQVRSPYVALERGSEPQLIEPEFPTQKPPLLEVADLLAYSALRVARFSDAGFFHQVVQSFAPRFQNVRLAPYSEMTPTSNPTEGIIVWRLHKDAGFVQCRWEASNGAGHTVWIDIEGYPRLVFDTHEEALSKAEELKREYIELGWKE